MNGTRRITIIDAGKISSVMIQAFRNCFRYIEMIASGRREFTLKTPSY